MLLGERGTGLRKVTVILNVDSGAGRNEKLVPAIREAFRTAGGNAQIVITGRRSHPDTLAKEAVSRGELLLVAAGGDGTVSAVASAVADTPAIMGVLPLGTLNHFAKDMGIPLDLERAAAVILGGKTAQVDAGEVNGRTFVNNSSLGLYPTMVFERELQRRTGRNKWAALLRASMTALRRFHSVYVRLSVNRRATIRRTPFVFIGNNEYIIEGLRMGTRERLDSGHLFLYIAQAASRGRLIWLALIALFGRLRTAKDFEVLCVDEVWIETRRRRLRVAIDGEVALIETPLHYRIWPGALRVLVP
jgi:diacylglycerol kinase family enzyme